jgi:cell division protein FtsL
MTPPAAAAAPGVAPRRPLAPRRPSRSAPRPRRVSGPAHPRRQAAPEVASGNGLAIALPAALRNLSNHRLLDRLIAGKAWIFLVAFALIGIVTLQLALLQLSSSIGRALERGNALQRENAALSIENSEMAAGDRVETRAAHLGMEIVPSGSLHFLAASPGADVGHAAAALTKPLSTSGEASSAATSSTSSGEASSVSHTPASGEAEEASRSSSTSGAAPSSETAAAPSSEAPAAGGHSESESAPASSSAPSGSTPAAGAASSGEAGPGGGTQPSPAG